MVVTFTGCNDFNAREIRQEQVESYQNELIRQSQEILSEDKQLSLEECISIALENNLDIRIALVQRQIAELGRQVSFSQFLPQVNLNYNYNRWDPQPGLATATGPQPMHDERVRELTFNVQMSVFNPSTWFMYSMHQRGQEIAEIAADYTKQMIILQVTTYYYYCLGLEQIENALQTSVKASEALAWQLDNLNNEGMIMPWQSEQANINIDSQKLQLKRVINIIEQTKGRLLIAMGLSPMNTIKLYPASSAEAPQGQLEDFIAEALLNHPKLRISDRQVAIEKEKVKIALAGFLPSLAGYANRVNTSDSFQYYSSYWLMGLSGVMTIFNGFANIHEYDAAKENVKIAGLEREQETLALVLEVFNAYQNLQLVNDSVALAERNYQVTDAHYNQVFEQWTEGMVNASDLLSVAADKEMANMVRINSQFQAQVSIATLLNAIGQTEININEAKDDSQS